MQFFNMKDVAKSWSTWVLGAVTVSPILSDKVEFFANLVPEDYRHWVISGLGILGLFVRSVKQKGLTK